MLPFRLHACVSANPPRSSVHVRRVRDEFGLPAGSNGNLRPRTARALWSGETVTLGPGRVILLTGRSGCGKSTALRLIERAVRNTKLRARDTEPPEIEVDRVDAIRLPPRTALIDAVAACVPGSGRAGAGDGRSEVYAAATAALARAGLADATTWIAPTGRLSDGQRFRARLAIAYARAGRGPRISADGCRSTDAPPQTASGKPETENLFRLLLIDEFGSGLDEQTAETVAVNLRRAVDELGLCAVLATAHDRLAGPLRPDERLHRPAGVRCGPSAFPASPSRRPAVIEIPPRVADEFLRTRHYKAGPVRGVVRAFGLFAGERMIGAATLAHPGGSLQAHLACGGDFMRAGAAAARRIRATLMINRVALDETVRGRGLGTALTAAVLQRCGAEVVLACAAMARHHPLFERAGMRPAGCASDGKPMLVWYRSWGAGRQGPAVSDER